LRVARDSNDEIGALVDAFNRMLAQIQTRDAEIEAARVALEGRTAELTAANEQLQSEVEERRTAEAALREAKEAAEAAECASRSKSQFLADMSQEIRTPMSSVQGMIELLLASELTPRQRHYAESVQRSSETLLDVFSGILDFSKVEAGRMEIEAVEFSCRETVAEVVSQLFERASRKGLRLTSRSDADVPGRVVGDPSRVKQVLVNLVGNAIKFTERGDVRIHLSVAERKGDTFELRFAIHDTGVGIAPDSQESIFEAFTQVEGESSPDQSGSGLGLTIAKQLVQLMGGQIGVESMPARGSTFWFTVRVPQARSDALTTARHEMSEIGPSPRFHGRVLVAVPETTRRQVVVQPLVEQGVEVSEARDAQEMFDAVLRGGFDLVFIDCDDAQNDGLAVTRAIRDAHNKAVWRMPIIGLSASSIEEARERCLRAGMDDCLAIPFETAQLLGVLARWLPSPDDLEATAKTRIPPEAVTTLEFGAIEEIRALARDDGQALLEKVLGLYCESVPQMLISMQEAARRGDCIALQRAAHALRTSSQNVGALRLAQLCRDVESGARTGVIRFDRLSALEFEFDSVRSKLKRVA
jgi:signal transduction histidine kinase/HPt (histidine-containing phosphotransfer) domain-containing protein